MVIGDLRQPQSFNRDTPEDQEEVLRQWCSDHGRQTPSWVAYVGMVVGVVAGIAIGAHMAAGLEG